MDTIELRKKRGKPLSILKEARCVALVDPVSDFQCLGEDLRKLSQLERLELRAKDDMTSLDFLDGLRTLRELFLHCATNLSDSSGILVCPRLRKIEIGWRTQFDFRFLEKIKTLESIVCVMCDEERIAMLTKAIQLKEVVLRGGFKLDTLQAFSGMSRIEVLQLWSGKIRSTVGIGSLTALRDLNLGYSDVQKVAEIRDLQALRRLQLIGNRSIHELESLACPSLEHLELFEIPRIASLQPLAQCTRLNEFRFTGEIADGNLSPLFALPKLKQVSLATRYKGLLARAHSIGDCAFHIGKQIFHLTPQGVKAITKVTIP